MNNPWLDIPYGDYVGHMSSPQVGQHQVLNALLADALASARPCRALILGCSTGNGLEHVDPAVTSHVVAVDINPAYLARLAERFPSPPFALELRYADLETCAFERDAFDLVHAALILEYVDWARVLPRVAAALRRGGVLSTVLQLPSPGTPAVTPSTYATLRLLESIFTFVDPELLVADAASLGLGLDSRRRERLASFKAFEVLSFTKG
ncbi:MAG TPA: class I SAM-dependent methyltransferase [Vicinamibacterales bacterium]